MASFWRKARVLWAVSLASTLEYRAETLIWMLSGTLNLVMMLVWMTQAQGAPGGQIGGYTPQAFAGYFLSTWLVSQLLVVWVGWELDYKIRQGTLSPELLRPLDPLWRDFAAHLTDKAFRLPIMLVLLLVFAALTGAHFTERLWAYPAVLTLALLGLCVRFLWEYTLGLLAFWTESSSSFSEVMWLFYAAFGGMFAPLSFYPQAVQDVARWTPFPYMLGLPAALLAGKASAAEALHGAGVLLGWLAALWLLRRWVWARGLAKYGAVGA
ncbi:ABC transporter permease [Deinococcus wulumuqiensis]